jgi:metal-responsive CopG/Arc/MetJ family transcriptional regulator
MQEALSMSKPQLPDHKTRVQTKLDAPLLSAIDAFRREQHNPPSRAEAIRLLCAKALSGRHNTQRRSSA